MKKGEEPQSQTWIKRVFRLGQLLVLALAVSYGFLLGFLYWWQEALIFPGKDWQGLPGAVVSPKSGEELLVLPTKGGQNVKALFGLALTAEGKPLPEAAGQPTVLYFYGSGGCMAMVRDEFEDLRRCGVNVLMADYLGYGMSEGTPSESGCYATADAVYGFLAARPNFASKRVVVMGRSLGTGVAVDLAARKPVGALVLYSAYTDMATMATLQYPLVPASLLLKHQFDNLGKIPRISCPMYVAHGLADDFIPPTQSEQLVKQARVPVTSYFPKGYNHDWFWGPAVISDLKQFLDRFQVGGSGKPAVP